MILSVYVRTNNLEGNPKFFLGSDSAPHPSDSKLIAAPGENCAAGVFTSPILLPLVAHILESFGALDKLEGFVSKNGRRFYGRPADKSDFITLERTTDNTVDMQYTEAGQGVIPFMAGEKLNWRVSR